MVSRKNIKLRSLYLFVCLQSVVILLATSTSAQTGASSSQGGDVFNVKAYGAAGDGTTDDTRAIQSAIDAATAAHGGIVYIPAGRYSLAGTLKSDRADMVSLVGAGMASRLLFKGKLGISLGSTDSHIADSGFHNGRIQGLFMSCADQASGIAVQMTDMISPPQLSDLSVGHCDQAFDIINDAKWTERLVAINVTDNYNNHLFHFDQNPKDKNDSYGYGTYDGIFINKSAGQDVFYLTGGAYLYHSSFIVKGNVDGGATNRASIFYVEGSSGQPCPGAAFNVVDIATEGSFYTVVKVTNSGCKGGSTGNPLVTGIGFVSATGSTPGDNNFISDPQKASYLVATFTATSSSSDQVKANNATPNAKCYVQPANPIAANAIVGTYVSGTNWGSVTVTHPPAANNGEYQVWCSP